MTDRLYRSPTDRVIAGVAGGLAAWLNIDPSLVRIAWALLAIFSGGLFLLVYFVMMIVVPLPPPGWVPRPRDAGPAGPAGPAWGGAPAPGPTAGGWSAPPPAWPSPPPDWSARGVGNAGLIGGAILVLLGTWFLVDDYVRIDWNLLWPVIVIVMGGLLIAGAIRRDR